MKEYPRLFNGEMVRAILSGRKAQTRVFADDRRFKGIQVGDVLWVRETMRLSSPTEGFYSADRKPLVFPQGRRIEWRDIKDRWSSTMAVPSIHMPRWASRITLEVTGVRVERLQDILEADAKAEGCCETRVRVGNGINWTSARGNFVRLWDSIYPKRGWDKNEEVKVIEFKRVKQRSDSK